VRLEFGKLPDAAGVHAALRVLESVSFETGALGSESEIEISLGRGCGGRVSGVYLGDSLEVCSFTLEPFELENAEVGTQRALEFVGQLRNVLSNSSLWPDRS
jgi:hypothetical protein